MKEGKLVAKSGSRGSRLKAGVLKLLYFTKNWWHGFEKILLKIGITLKIKL